MHCEEDSTKDARCRTRLRIAQISSSGRNEPCSSPTACKYCSHWASLTSLLRPGTCLTCRALTSTTSKPRFFQQFVQGNPIHPGRFHRHGLDPQPLQVIRNRQQIPREAAE